MSTADDIYFVIACVVLGGLLGVTLHLKLVIELIREWLDR